MFFSSSESLAEDSDDLLLGKMLRVPSENLRGPNVHGVTDRDTFALKVIYHLLENPLLLIES
jgi:hypothetical protein